MHYGSLDALEQRMPDLSAGIQEFRHVTDNHNEVELYCQLSTEVNLAANSFSRFGEF